MQYEPIKRSLGSLFSGPPFMRKLLYFLVDLLLLRTWHVNKALRKIRPELPVNASILDAGSGMGQYTWRMSRMSPGWRITGIDINKSEVDDCNGFILKSGLDERITFKTSDLTQYREAESFNLILSVDVMEHIADDELVFRNFFESLRHDGILLLSTPSDKGGSDVHDSDDKSFIGEHVRNGYGITDIEDKLSREGFTEVNAVYTYGIAGSVSWHLTMKYPVKLLNISKLFFILLPFYYIVVFPFSLILNMLDVHLTHKTGTGLLVTARKK